MTKKELHDANDQLKDALDVAYLEIEHLREGVNLLMNYISADADILQWAAKDDEEYPEPRR